MHNCKTTKERITELLLDGAQTQPVELRECSDCSNEFESLKETLRISRRQIETAAPTETYWNGYHARLRTRLVNGRSSGSARRQGSWVSSGSWLRGIISASIRVPIPLAAAVLTAFLLSMIYVSRRSVKVSGPPTVSVVQVPVEVPVIQEKVVTKVVYRERKKKAASSYATPNDSALAKSQKVNVPSLVGFKPTDEVKFTVIKGGSPDEK